MNAALAAALAVLALVAFASAGVIGHQEAQQEEAYHVPVYKYEYGVHDPHHGDVKNQYESRHGDQVKGSYSVVEPDGKVRKVEYTSDKHNGFQAIVSREGKITLHGYGEQDVKGLDGGDDAGQGGYSGQEGYSSQGGYSGQEGYSSQGGYSGQGGYSNQGGYSSQGGYSGQGGYSNQGGYAAAAAEVGHGSYLGHY